MIHIPLDSEIILVSQQVSACHLSSKTFKDVKHNNIVNGFLTNLYHIFASLYIDMQ